KPASNSAGKTNSTSASTIRKANAICKGAQPVRVEVDEELGSPSTCGNLLQSKARPSKKRCKRAWTCHVMAQASPPALSRQIRDLEDELGFLLLERSARSVRL